VTDLSIKQGDTQRHVAIVTPPAIGPGERLPLVVLLHGHNGNADAVVTQGGWKEQVIAHRFIVAAPDGISQSWNAGGCCRLATLLGIEDVPFLDAVIADLARRPTVDPARIYLAGVSNGGMMAYRYLCDHADRIAAAASIEGTNVSGCTPNRALPILHVAGTADRVVPYRGGRSTIGTLLGPGTFPPVPSSMARLAAADGCDRTSTTADVGAGVRTRRWTGCRDGATVQLDTVDGLGHDYPKGAPFDATDAILEFFGLTG
jgi:polyhydroxybutyrate depolymerase